MTMHRRRLLCFALALTMMIALIPAATGSISAARAETKRLGITLTDKVNTRWGAGGDKDIAFVLPVNHVCEILDTKIAQNVTWYKIRTINPERKNSDLYTVYVHGDFFRELTAEEIAQYNASGTVATPTPVPTSRGSWAPDWGPTDTTTCWRIGAARSIPSNGAAGSSPSTTNFRPTGSSAR